MSVKGKNPNGMAGLIAGLALLALAGCNPVLSDAAVNGKWKGNIAAGDRNSDVEINLRLISMQLEGEFTPLGDAFSGIKAGENFRILRTRVEGSKLFFTVPLSGKVDDKSLVFELTLTPNRLEGIVHQRAPGSPEIQVTFTREE